MKFRTTRTYLAVPAHQVRLVKSAAASAADAVFLDLEDAVPPSQKDEALATAIDAINHLEWGKKTVSVRVNVPSSSLIENELSQLLRRAPRLDTVLVPKVEQVEQIHFLESIVTCPSMTRDGIGLEVMIETALGLVNCDAIAASSPLIESLHFGVGDFSASIGAKSVDIGLSPPSYQHPTRMDGGSYAGTTLDLWAYPMMRLLVAARAYGLRAVDGPCGAFRDAVLTRDLALKAAAMGFDGKQVIHPKQLDITRAAFTPTELEVTQARSMLDAISEAERAGKGAIQVEGKLVDYANVRMARRVMAMADIE